MAEITNVGGERTGAAEQARNRARLRIVSIDESQVIALFRAATKNAPDYLSLPVFNDLPDDIEIVGVMHSFERQAFLIKIRHPSFSPVPPGGQVPFHGSVLHQIGMTFDLRGARRVGEGKYIAGETIDVALAPGHDVRQVKLCDLPIPSRVMRSRPNRPAVLIRPVAGSPLPADCDVCPECKNDPRGVLLLDSYVPCSRRCGWAKNECR